MAPFSKQPNGLPAHIQEASKQALPLHSLQAPMQPPRTPLIPPHKSPRRQRAPVRPSPLRAFSRSSTNRQSCISYVDRRRPSDFKKARGRRQHACALSPKGAVQGLLGSTHAHAVQRAKEWAKARFRSPARRPQSTPPLDERGGGRGRARSARVAQRPAVPAPPRGGFSQRDWGCQGARSGGPARGRLGRPWPPAKEPGAAGAAEGSWRGRVRQLWIAVSARGRK